MKTNFLQFAPAVPTLDGWEYDYTITGKQIGYLNDHSISFISGTYEITLTGDFEKTEDGVELSSLNDVQVYNYETGEEPLIDESFWSDAFEYLKKGL